MLFFLAFSTCFLLNKNIFDIYFLSFIFFIEWSEIFLSEVKVKKAGLIIYLTKDNKNRNNTIRVEQLKNRKTTFKAVSYCQKNRFYCTVYSVHCTSTLKLISSKCYYTWFYSSSTNSNQEYTNRRNSSGIIHYFFIRILKWENRFCSIKNRLFGSYPTVAVK